MSDLLSPYVQQGLTVVIQIAALAAIYGLAILRRKIEVYMQANLDVKQTELLHLLGKEAFAFAETAYKELQGPDKLSAALDYLQKQAKAKGIPFDPEAARAAVEKAWVEVQGTKKQTGYLG